MKEFYFSLKDGKGHGWVYAHEYKFVSREGDTTGVCDKVIFYRDGKKCASILGVASVSEILVDEKP